MKLSLSSERSVKAACLPRSLAAIVAATTAITVSIYGVGFSASATESAPATAVGAVDTDSTAVSLLTEGLDLDAAADIAFEELVGAPVQSTGAIASNAAGLAMLPEAGDSTLALLAGESGETITVTIPSAGDVVSNDFASVIETTTDDDDAFIVQANELGAQIINVATVPATTHEFSLETTVPDGASWSTTESGSLQLLDVSGQIIAASDVPWAVDANGAVLETSFHIDGSTITQHVDTAEATFPVVSDPDLWWVIGTAALCAAEIASLAVGAAKVISLFAKADRIVKSMKAVVSAYKTLGNSMDKVFTLLKKYIKTPKNLTRSQTVALEDFIKKVGTAVFNAIGLGSCLSLVTG